jgi:hypothetical protein
MFTTLSILVYLAEVIERVEAVTFGLGLFFGISACISLIIMGCCAAENEFDTSKTGVKKWCKYTFISVIVAVVFIALSALVPTKKAVYMIAGIQAAEYLVNTETAKDIGNEGVKIFKDVGTIIHSYAVDAVGTVKEKVTDGAKKAAETTSKVVEAVKDSASSVVKETVKETIGTDK